jgi:hypothetical protein
MFARTPHRNINCHVSRGNEIRSFLPISGERFCSRHTKVVSGPSRRTQEGSIDNATLRLDSSLETPTVKFPPLFVPVVRTAVCCLSARIAISLEVYL